MFVFTYSQRENTFVCWPAGPQELFWQRTGYGWRGTGHTAGALWPDVWRAHLYLPTQDSNSKEALAMTVLV